MNIGSPSFDSNLPSMPLPPPPPNTTPPPWPPHSSSPSSPSALSILSSFSLFPFSFLVSLLSFALSITLFPSLSPPDPPFISPPLPQNPYPTPLLILPPPPPHRQVRPPHPHFPPPLPCPPLLRYQCLHPYQPHRGPHRQIPLQSIPRLHRPHCGRQIHGPSHCHHPPLFQLGSHRLLPSILLPSSYRPRDVHGCFPLSFSPPPNDRGTCTGRCHATPFRFRLPCLPRASCRLLIFTEAVEQEVVLTEDDVKGGRAHVLEEMGGDGSGGGGGKGGAGG